MDTRPRKLWRMASIFMVLIHMLAAKLFEGGPTEKEGFDSVFGAYEATCVQLFGASARNFKFGRASIDAYD